ncbi:MAG TPA: hypothetical protein VGM92_10025 [Candidatus Kapabacteria bacterium]|jgi:hypothetical protein
MIQEPDTAVAGLIPEQLRVSQIFEAAARQAQSVPERIITYNASIQTYHAYAGELTLVMCRDIRKSVDVASAICLAVAGKYPDRNILMFNTYASADLLTGGFVRALHFLNLKVPFTFQNYLPRAKKDAFDDTVDLPSPENLRVVDCPTSTLTPDSLRREIEKSKAKIVVLNSLEFAGFSDRAKRELAEAVLDLRHQLGITFFVFTHEMRVAMPYTGGRGPVGMLTAFARSIWHIVNDWEKPVWVRKLLDEEARQHGVQP